MRYWLLLLAAVLAACVVYAVYWVTHICSESKIVEPIQVTEVKEFEETMYPGEINVWRFSIENHAPDVDYLVTIKLVVFKDTCFSGAFDGKCVDISKLKCGSTDLTSDFKRDGEASIPVPAGSRLNCELVINSAGDTPPGNVKVCVKVGRT